VRPAGRSALDVHNHVIVPGFVDVHVHGVEGIDSLDGPDAISSIAGRLPKYGVTAFCPTSVACGPDALRTLLDAVNRRRTDSNAQGARVLPAHLESNFISPEYRGAQPERCLRLPPTPGARRGSGDTDFDGTDILAEIDAAGEGVGIVTLAPELPGAHELIRYLTGKGRRVSLGHSGATFDQGRAAIAAGARHATHLFNRMPPLHHRDPGLAAAILEDDGVAAEIICDGVHVHPAMIRLSLSLKHAHRLFAITDGTAAAGLPEGSHALLGGRRITVSRSAAYLDDGTLAGSVATMDLVLRFLVTRVGLSLNEAVRLCSTTPAEELGLRGLGIIAKDATADFVVLDRHLAVKQTYIAGRLVYSSL
jgi:N-acetylglucosamine-6-phosphate deacetylase